jgi:hypothetical protein
VNDRSDDIKEIFDMFIPMAITGFEVLMEHEQDLLVDGQPPINSLEIRSLILINIL